MLKYCYGTLINTSAPHFKGILQSNVAVFVNTNKIRNFVPYVSTLISYIPFFTGNYKDHAFVHGTNEFCVKYEMIDKKYERLDVKLVGIECNLASDFDKKVPGFLKVYKDDEFTTKYFPDYYAKFYLKQYSVGTLQLNSFEKFILELSKQLSKDNKNIELKHIKSCEVDDGLSCFEAEYIEN